MSTANQTVDQQSNDKTAIVALYQALLAGWNRRNAAEMAALFTEGGSVVGFDGSQMNGRAEIESTLAPIFADHPTAAYVGKVEEVHFLAPDVALLRAIAGMTPPGSSTINPNLNTVQSIVATRQEDGWRLALYHNTPAQLHGRPEMVKQMTEELQQMLG